MHCLKLGIVDLVKLLGVFQAKKSGIFSGVADADRKQEVHARRELLVKAHCVM